MLEAPIVQIEIKKHKKAHLHDTKDQMWLFFKKLQVHDWAPYLYMGKNEILVIVFGLQITLNGVLYFFYLDEI